MGATNGLSIGSERLDLSGVSGIPAGKTDSLPISEGAVKPAPVIDLKQKPVDQEAYAYLTAKREGSHSFMNFLPKFMQVMIAEALGRQINGDEIKFFVGFDGGPLSAICHLKWNEWQNKADSIVREIQAKLEADLKTVDGFTNYSEAARNEEKDLRMTEVQQQIQKIRSEVPSEIQFTPVFWVDPRINPKLLGEIALNGKNVERAFLTGDMKNGIIRSGCFYETDKGLIGFSGSPWFFNKVTHEFQISHSALGKAAVRHQEAKNKKQDVDTYFNKKGFRVHLRQYWGISNQELDRRDRASAQNEATASTVKTSNKDDTKADQLIDRLFGTVTFVPARTNTGKGCK